MKTTTLLILGFSITGFVNSQEFMPISNLNGQHTFNSENSAENPCISDLEYENIIVRCDANRKLLKLPSSSTVSKVAVPLIWPLQSTSNLNDCSYYRVSAHVDHDANAGAIKDYNCGVVTYDGHRGTDIATWPFNFYKMDNDMVEVVASAPGILLDKHDGEFDRNCVGNNLTANYAIIQHSDGSVALYWHMKSGKVTTKNIGEAIAAGEYLGVVGSSGSSSGPHLHFEVWAGNTNATRIDPYSGNCNTLNVSSYWSAQKSYKETAVVKASVHTTDIVLPPCPASETLNQTNSFTLPFQGAGLPAGFGKFYIFLREELAGQTATMSILNPNGSTLNSWTYISAADSRSRTMGWSKSLPSQAGIYTFKANYNGTECSSTFEIIEPLALNEKDLFAISVYPNPSNGKFTFNFNQIQAESITIINLIGETVFHAPIEHSLTKINLEPKSGIYFYSVLTNNGIPITGKLIVE